MNDRDPLDLLWAEQAARILGTTKGEVNHLAYRGRLRFRWVGEQRMFERGEIERFRLRLTKQLEDALDDYQSWRDQVGLELIEAPA